MFESLITVNRKRDLKIEDCLSLNFGNGANQIDKKYLGPRKCKPSFKEGIRHVGNSNLVSLVKQYVIRYKRDNTERKMKFLFTVLLLAMVVLATNANQFGSLCVCTREMAPVCTTTGVTYSNKCEFQCAKGRLQGRAAEAFKIARGGACNGPEVPEFARDVE